jgi:anti-sigma B factor antagonist
MEVVVRAHKEATVVDLHGRLDSAARWNFKAIMKQCCLTEQDHLVINLQSLSYIDSAGLGFLVLAYVQFTGLQRKMSWVQPRGHVKTLLDSLDIPSLVPVYATEQEAFESAAA